MTRPVASTPTRSTTPPRRPRTSSRSSTTARRSRRALAVLTVAVVGLAACGDDGGSIEALCSAVAEEGVTTALEGFDPSDPESALDQLRGARVALGDLLDAAPAEVRDDLEVEVDYLQALIDALEPVEPGDATEAALQVQSVTDAHPGVDEAAANLAAFSERECAAAG